MLISITLYSKLAIQEWNTYHTITTLLEQKLQGIYQDPHEGIYSKQHLVDKNV